jgi:hypothetical protein
MDKGGRSNARKFHRLALDHWRIRSVGAIVPAGQGIAHETNGHSAELGLCRLCGRFPADIRRGGKGFVLALQCAYPRAAVSPQQARRSDLGFRLVLERLRLVLRVGLGRLPQRRFSRSLPEAHRQMRSLLPTGMPHQRRPAASHRISLGLATPRSPCTARARARTGVLPERDPANR